MWLIQSAISSVGMKSLQGGCVLMCIVMVLCGSFVPLLFHVPLFWSKSHTLQKNKTKQKYLHINISHRVAAEDGNQDLTRGELSMDKKNVQSKYVWDGRCDVNSHRLVKPTSGSASLI